MNEIKLNTQNKTLNETEKDTKTIFKISRNINEKTFTNLKDFISWVALALIIFKAYLSPFRAYFWDRYYHEKEYQNAKDNTNYLNIIAL
ncbi:hypothetical protein [Campylobacter jejuni]|uniref:hypothetical protein n=1 Tax=Campylobacter jejuni TaxID=197 RepID=UPI00111E1D17|nr:hypothetical protein [Campylobacter jejuni]